MLGQLLIRCFRAHRAHKARGANPSKAKKTEKGSESTEERIKKASCCASRSPNVLLFNEEKSAIKAVSARVREKKLRKEEETERPSFRKRGEENRSATPRDPQTIISFSGREKKTEREESSGSAQAPNIGKGENSSGIEWREG